MNAERLGAGLTSSEAAARPADAQAAGVYQALLESMTEGVSLAAEDGTIVYTNPAEDRMFGYGPGELVGRHVSVQNAYPEEENRRRVGEVIEKLKSTGFWEGEWRNRRKDGGEFTTASRITAVDLEGRPHWLCVQRDVTRTREIEAALATSEQRLRLATEGTGVGTYDLDLSTGDGSWSAAAFEMLGVPVPPDLKANYATWRASIHPDDVHRVEAEHGRAAEAGGPWQIEYKILRGDDGSTRWLQAHGRFFKDPGGSLRSVGIVTDVTEQREAQAALHESQRRLDLAVRAHGIGIFDWWIQTGKVVWSEQEEELFGLEPGTFEGTIAGWGERVLPEDLEAMQADMAAAMERRDEHFDFGFRIRRADGEVRYIEGSSWFLYAEDGTPQRMVGTNMDLTERKRAEEHQRLLINELNHRVKNTLATVQGIAHQSFRGEALSPAASAAFEGRLAALSAAHDVLTEENWSAASVGQIVEDAVAPYPIERFETAGPDTRLPPRESLSLALALHELITNAVKYGALSNDSGRVRISWQACETSFRLEWREMGGPVVAAPARKGFGTRMIERALAADFGGRVELDFAPEGVTCSLDCPLPKPKKVTAILS